MRVKERERDLIKRYLSRRYTSSVAVSTKAAGCLLSFLRLRAGEEGVVAGYLPCGSSPPPGFSIQTLLQTAGF